MLANRYELDREIGRGGMGAVWLAHDTLLDRAVAIKQIGNVAGGSHDFARAEREAHLAARVNHQNVVMVFDFVDGDDWLWMVMEHVDGPTLAAMVAERGRVNPDELAPVIAQIAGALAAAHKHGIVHRDVKPSNILMARDGVAKLSDFGVARSQADASLTQTGMITGSPDYLAPEVASGRQATTASDVWSLGATIFHALSGRPPYQVADNVLGTMYRIVNEEPPRLDDPGHLTELVATMMQQDPDARPTMLEVQAVAAGNEAPPAVGIETTQTMAAVDVDASPVTRVPIISETQRRAWWAGGIAAALLATVLLASTLGTDSPPLETPEALPTASEATPVAGTDPETARLEGFVADYLTAASNNPEVGFAMLTKKYQQKSGGFEGYSDFWSKVSNLDVAAVAANTKKETVAYTYSYDFDGKRRTEDIVLKLKEKDGTLLIDGAD